MTRSKNHWLNQVLTTLLCVVLVALIAGCPKPKPDEGQGDAANPPVDLPDIVDQVDPDADKPLAPPKPIEQAPESVPTGIPAVKMTDKDRETCLLWVGQPVPDVELRNLSDQPVMLKTLLGKKATVLFFWSRGKTKYSPMAAQAALQDLDRDIWQPFHEQGVAVVLVNEGDLPQEIIDTSQSAGLKDLPMLTDPQLGLLNQMATAYLPRIYVLDAEGKILWLDIEYSETTRDELLDTVRFIVGQ